MTISVFTISCSKYLLQSIMTLLSVSKYNDYDLFIVSDNFSKLQKKLLSTHNIKFIETNLPQPISWAYASSILLKKGYQYSIKLSYDVYCNKKISYNFTDLKTIAIAKKKINKMRDRRKKKNRYLINAEYDVMFLNNNYVEINDFLQKASDIYHSFKNSGVIKEIDSLTRLTVEQVLSAHLAEFVLLGEEFNFLSTSKKVIDRKSYLTDNETMINKCIFFNFNQQKPWMLHNSFNNYTYKFFYQKWQARAINNLKNSDIKKLLPFKYKKSIVGSDKIRFYWYKDVLNAGDFITPYFLKKVCKLKKIEYYSPKKKKKC